MEHACTIEKEVLINCIAKSKIHKKGKTLRISDTFSHFYAKVTDFHLIFTRSEAKFLSTKAKRVARPYNNIE